MECSSLITTGIIPTTKDTEKILFGHHHAIVRRKVGTFGDSGIRHHILSTKDKLTNDKYLSKVDFAGKN